MKEQLYTTLNNGTKMPLLGLGVYDMHGQETERAVATALEIGLDFPIGTPLPTQFSQISYFKGSLDDLEFYNIALSDGQVTGLYNNEK